MTAGPPPAEPAAESTVAITIDGRELRVSAGTLVLDAATAAGVHIPVYCAHPKLDPVAVCRMCLVRIERMPKLQPACATPVSEGMSITTASDEVARMRESMLEMLLLNHPLDCPVCDRGGECDLQDFAFRYGPPVARFPITEKVHFDKAVRLSDRIELDQERCILCWRCTRYYEEITGERELVLMQRGVHTVVAPFDGQPLRSTFQGNLPEICPVGALTHVPYRFRARPWDLQRTASVCPECSHGCNLNADSREYALMRFASRDNPEVDDMWLCDRGRYSATLWNEQPRVRHSLVRPRGGPERQVEVQEAVGAAAAQLRAVVSAHGGAAVGVIGSAEATNEELWMLQRLAREVLGSPHLDHQLEPFPDLTPVEHELGIAEIERCGAVVVLGPEPERQAPVLSLRLYKAATKRGVAVHRVELSTPGAEVASLVAGRAPVGLVADETDRRRAADLAAELTDRGAVVRRLTVTRGVNGRGAKDLGVLPGLLPGYRAAPRPGRHGREILAATAAGEIRALLLLGASASLTRPGASGSGVAGTEPWRPGAASAESGTDPAAPGPAGADLALLRRALAVVEVLVVIDSRPGPLSEAATVLIPGHAFFEKAGTVTNLEGRVQRIRPALPPAGQAPPETRVLAQLAADLGGGEWGSGDPAALGRALAEAVPAYGAAAGGRRAVWARLGEDTP